MISSCFHQIRRALCLAFLLAFMAKPSFGQTPLQDDFSTYAPGSDASPAWAHSTGFWYVADGRLCEASGAYDAGAFVPRFLDTPYEVSVRFRMDSAYRGAGVLFNSSS